MWVSGYYSGSTPWLIRTPGSEFTAALRIPWEEPQGHRAWKRNCLLGDNVNLSLHGRLSLHRRMKFLANFLTPISQTPSTFKFKLLSCARRKKAELREKKQRPYQQWEHYMASQTFLNLLNAGGEKKKTQQKQQWEW